MAKQIIKEIEYCEDCPYFRAMADRYKRSDDNYRYALICEKDLRMMYYGGEYCGATTKIPEDCSL